MCVTFALQELIKPIKGTDDPSYSLSAKLKQHCSFSDCLKA